MDEVWKKARLDELWDAYVPLTAGSNASANEPRALRAIEALAAARDEHAAAKAERDIASMIVIISKARMVWQLLSLEVGDWIVEDGLNLLALSPDDRLPSRLMLKMDLGSHAETGPHPHRPAVDPVPVLLPRWLVAELRSALAALDEGETQDIVRPTAEGRHGDAWTWDQMKACALEHVAFLHGQGSTKKIAQQRVAARMGVPPNSLRDWERNKDLKAGYSVAFEAGKLKVIFDDEPNYAEGDGNSVDSGALARLHSFRSDPSLIAFGQAYRERFGHRHNPDGSVGN